MRIADVEPCARARTRAARTTRTTRTTCTLRTTSIHQSAIRWDGGGSAIPAGNEIGFFVVVHEVGLMGSKKLTLNTEACGVWACRTCRPRDTTNGGLEQQPPDDTKPLYPPSGRRTSPPTRRPPARSRFSKVHAADELRPRAVSVGSRASQGVLCEIQGQRGVDALRLLRRRRAAPRGAWRMNDRTGGRVCVCQVHNELTP